MWPESLGGTHRGETGVVIANGPSLNDVPIDFLQRHPAIGCNHLGCACDHTFFYADYWCQTGIDQVRTRQQREHYWPAIANAEVAFVNMHVAGAFPQDNVIGIMSRAGQGMPLPEPHKNQTFSKDPLRAVGVGFTQTYISLQIAYWLGFETVLIVGLDGGYDWALRKYGRRHFYPDKEHNSTPSIHGDAAFKEGSNYVFGLAREAYEEDGRRIINLSPETFETVFEKGKLEDWDG